MTSDFNIESSTCIDYDYQASAQAENSKKEFGISDFNMKSNKMYGCDDIPFDIRILIHCNICPGEKNVLSSCDGYG